MDAIEQRIKAALARNSGTPDRVLYDLIGSLSSVRKFNEALEGLIASGEVIVLETRGDQRLISLPSTPNVAQI